MSESGRSASFIPANKVSISCLVTLGSNIENVMIDIASSIQRWRERRSVSCRCQMMQCRHTGSFAHVFAKRLRKKDPFFGQTIACFFSALCSFRHIRACPSCQLPVFGGSQTGRPTPGPGSCSRPTSRPSWAAAAAASPTQPTKLSSNFPFPPLSPVHQTIISD